MRRIRKFFIIKIAIIALLFLLLVGCSVFKRDKSTDVSHTKNTNQVVYKTNYDESSIKDDASEQKIEKLIEVNEKIIEKSSDNKIIKIKYPFIVKSILSQTVVDKVNDVIENFIKNKLDEAEKDKGFSILGISYEYNFYKSKDIFSVIFFIDSGESGGYYESKAFNFDLRNGELLQREKIIDTNALRKIRSYIAFISATCSNIELNTPKYRESLEQAIENTNIQIDDKILLKDDGIEIYFPSFDIDPNGKNSAVFYVKYSELNKPVIKKIDIHSLNELEELLQMKFKDIKSNFGLCDLSYMWEGAVYYNIGAVEWAFNPEDGFYEEEDFKTPNAIVFRSGANIFGVDIEKTTPDQAYEILKRDKSGAIKEVSKGKGVDSSEVITCELINGVTIYFEVDRKSIDSNELKIVDAIINLNDWRKLMN